MWAMDSGRQLSALTQRVGTSVTDEDFAPPGCDGLTDSLYVNHRQVKDGTQTDKAFVAPICRISVELLREIFSLSRRYKENMVTTDTQSFPSTMLRLSWVNRHWRRVAQESPHLWDSVRVTAGVPSQSKYSQNVLLRLFLGHSKNVPIDIEFRRLTTTFHAIDIQNIHSLISISSRWRSVTIDDNVLCYFPHIEGSLPLLETLSVESSKIHGGFQNQFFRNAPSLRNLEVQTFWIAPFSWPIAPSWGNIKDLKLHGSIGEVRKLLDLGVELDSLTLIHRRGMFDRPNVTIIPTLTSLEILTLPDEIDHHNPLPLLNLPFLRNLIIHINSPRPLFHWDSALFSQFISDSGCHIREIRFKGVDITQEAMLNALALVPQLEILKWVPIFTETLDVGFLKELNTLNTDDHNTFKFKYVPLLRSLILTNIFISTFERYILLKLMDERTKKTWGLSEGTNRLVEGTVEYTMHNAMMTKSLSVEQYGKTWDSPLDKLPVQSFAGPWFGEQITQEDWEIDVSGRGNWLHWLSFHSTI